MVNVVFSKSYCFAKKGEIYAVYFPFGGTSQIDLSDAKGDFSIDWYNPRTGGDLQKGSITKQQGGGVVNIGSPPTDVDKDWAVIMKKR